MTVSAPLKPAPPLTVTVIIPTFNRADLLGETIEAVIGQTRKPEEILVVNDGSDDHTNRVVAAFGDQVELISKANSGKADSLNQAIAASNGSHIWIVDDDDIPRPDALETLTKLMAANAGIDIAYGRHIRFSQSAPDGPKTYQETGYWDTRGPTYFLIATLEDFFVHQPAMLVSRALYDRAGPFNTEMIASEDYEMLIRLSQYGTAAASEKIIFEQRVHSGVRGQKGHQFAAADRNAKWIDYDKKIFRSAYKNLPLSAYLPRGMHNPDTPDAQRQALVQRSCVMGRKKLWDLAILDLHTISKGTVHAPLSTSERAILRRTLLSKYGCDEIFKTPNILAELRNVRASSNLGKSLVAGIGRSLLWHFRTELAVGQFSRAVQALRAYLKLR